MVAVESTSIFLNWSFWAVVVAAIALILSQIPPILLIIRSTHIRVEPHDRVMISHWLGNPSVNLYLALTNTGGRKVSVLSLDLKLQMEDGNSFSLPAQSFQIQGNIQNSFLFTRITLKPDETWSNFVSFAPHMDTTDERKTKQLMKELRNDINQKIANKLKANPAFNGKLEAEEKLVLPIVDFFDKHNKWRAGEYVVQLHVNCEPKKASITRDFRFTIYESDVQDLSDVSRYKYGAGVYYLDNEVTPVYPQIKNVV